MTHSKILGTGGYLPEKVLTNHDLEAMVETSDAWIQERTGIRKRHIVSDTESTCDLAEQAARCALDMAGCRPEEIDLIIIATTTPDQIFPSTASILQQRLRIHNACPVFDIQAVCTGFVYALGIADQFIRNGSVKRALVIGAESFSRIIDWTDRGTCVLFGDGAGAVVLGASDEQGIIATHLHADGRYRTLLHVPGGPGKAPADHDAWDHHVHMKGNEVFKWAVNTLGKIAEETLEANGFAKSDLDWLIPHQANVRIIQATARKLKLPMERVVVTVQDHGNTSAASVPLALDVAVRDGRIQPGQLLLMEAFGGGFTWGSALVRF
ncbi:3-oxoacyl-[acyl-carrier-protein] synthase III [Ectothiorhodosinus mongolicus]|uniref:Beta-ketoacyl-[acyl-carrier-protein] synthase III n=1 Tax=Ectothiorhodosinus mongolicus TaxID=233100 RepID=A0A1R3VP08_9GAMM|nr:beta-ketoacyl-ACP synthase III [Ectothiorhodosinus mongolicus]ULX57817.1 ketoacyl-ACP synthase III [Ectothiorhodosinus mongolicus]SIT65685.1 3-oxoacyl-[acyl-carrier-protein] synthase III [Ectothiorhodosinus mongolicus]